MVASAAMNLDNAVTALAALAQPTRLALFRLLVERGPGAVPAGEIAEALGVPATTLSFHLKTLTQAGLIAMAAEGRFVRYRAQFPAMLELVAYLTENCCQGDLAACQPQSLPELPTPSLSPTPPMPSASRPLHVLVLCTGNSARSILAEALFNHLGAGRIKAWSAGSQPAGQVNPYALQLLARQGLATDRLHSKSWDEFATGPEFDLIITVCDNAAGETCPVWPGHPLTGHWGIPDPATAPEGAKEEDFKRAFERAYKQLQRRIQALLALPLETMDRAARQQALATIHAAAEGDRA